MSFHWRFLIQNIRENPKKYKFASLDDGKFTVLLIYLQHIYSIQFECVDEMLWNVNHSSQIQTNQIFNVVSVSQSNGLCIDKSNSNFH